MFPSPGSGCHMRRRCAASVRGMSTDCAGRAESHSGLNRACTWMAGASQLPDLAVILNQAARERAAGPASVAGSASGGPPAARRATLVATLDQNGFRHHAGVQSRLPRSRLSTHQGFGAYEEEGGRAAALIKRRRSWTEAAPITRPAILPSGQITSVLGKALMGMSRLNSAAIRSPGSLRLG